MTWLLGQEGLTLTFQENVWWWWREEASWFVGGGGIFDPQNNFALHFLFKILFLFFVTFLKINENKIYRIPWEWILVTRRGLP